MLNFSGDVGKSRKVDLRGRSKAEPTREQVLEQTRQEREKRKRGKLEQQSALVIQSHWRRWRQSRCTRHTLKQQWIEAYGESGQAIDRNSLPLSQPCLPALLHFSCTSPSLPHVHSPEADLLLNADVRRLAAACRQLLSLSSQAQLMPTLLPPAVVYAQPTPSSTSRPPAVLSQQGVQLPRPLSELLPTYTTAANSLSPAARVVHLLARLASHCLTALSRTCTQPEARALLAQPRPAAAQLADPAALPDVHVLIETLLWLVTPDSWSWINHVPTETVSQPTTTWTAASATNSIITHLILGPTPARPLPTSRSTTSSPAKPPSTAGDQPPVPQAASRQLPPSKVNVFRCLSRLLLAVQAASGSAAARSRTYTELLTTQLCVRALPVKSASGQAVLDLIDPGQGAHLLLCVPEVWSTCPSLAPIAKHLTRLAAVTLTATPPRVLLSAPSRYLLSQADGVATGPAGAAAALLVNLVHGGVKTLPSPGAAVPNPAAAQAAALPLCSALTALLCVLPEQLLHVGSTADASKTSDQEAEEQLAVQEAALYRSRGTLEAAAGQQLPRLRFPEEEMLPVEVSTSLQVLTDAPGQQLLRALVHTLLPLSGPADAISAPDPSQLLSQHLSGALQLAQLIQQLGLIVHSRHLLHISLALSSSLVPRLWWSVLRPLRLQQQASTGGSNGQTEVSKVAGETGDASSLLQLFCSVFSAQLAVVDVDEFFSGVPLPLSELYDNKRPAAGVLGLLKDKLWSILWMPDMQMNPRQSSASRQGAAASTSSAPTVQDEVLGLRRDALARAAGVLYGALYDRHIQTGKTGERWQFCPTSAFHASNLGPERFAQEASGPSGMRGDMKTRIRQVIHHAPALVPFEERARLFQSETEMARHEFLASEEHTRQEAAFHGMFTPPSYVSVRRSHLLEDGFDRLFPNGPDMCKGRVRVQFVDAAGQVEAGLDGGGLFKEFMECLIQEGFGPEAGLFATNAQRELYPSVSTYMSVPGAHQKLTFLGRMLGKAMWEGILVELPLARFFLKRLRGARCDLHDLPSLDQQLYNNLKSLKSYKGDWSELSLQFTVTCPTASGGLREQELKPGGSHIQVCAENVAEYLARVADFRLNVEPWRAITAFAQGFYEMIDPEWVGLFNEAELQMLISGRSEEGRAGIDVEDLRAHTEYSGGYHVDHPVVNNLWIALSEFTPEQQHAFLKFTTSCSRPPLLGFKYLQPCFCVAMAVDGQADDGLKRLPTASTCMNLLKLPPYTTRQGLKEKLLMAITEAKSFDLS